MIALPSAPTGTPSSQCGLEIPAASVASTSGLPNPQYWWYSTPAGTTVLQTPPLSNTLSTYYTNNFTSSTLTNSSIAGAASISGGLLALQPTITSSGGSITVNASGLNNTIYQTDFDVSLIATGTTIADGFSYSIGDDAIPFSNATTPSAEKGSGSKIRIGFFTFNAANGSDGKGIYLGYGVSATSGYTAGTPGMLGYNGTNLGRIPVAAGTVTSHVTVTINAAGQLTLVVGGVTIFNNVQLPPAYLSANKSNWKHIISSRSTEKPMTPDEIKCKRILDAEKRTGKKVIVAFNYRHSVHAMQVKELVSQQRIGKVTSVDFNWYLNVYHGADYFRRWHGRMNRSRSLWVHKSTHHFDLLNWWLNSEPVEVSAYGALEHYGKNNVFRGTKCRGCEYKDKCKFFWDITKDERLNNLYAKNEKHDGYIRDGLCVEQ